MRISPLALVPFIVALLPKGSSALEEIPTNADDFNEPAWETIIESAFPPWATPAAGCPRLDAVDGTLLDDFNTFPTPETGKFNPCYYTKAFAGLDPSKGGYPTPIDTHYPYEFAAPFLGQPGDGSVKHCPQDSEGSVNIGKCPKFGQCEGVKDCAIVSDDYGIGHIPPFVPLAAIKKEYMAAMADNTTDICESFFHFETSGCNIKKSALDEVVWKYFGDAATRTVKFQPPILIDGEPSSTYFRLEYGGESPACDDGNCRGPHYCSKEVADEDMAWGDFCPYVHTGENSGLYRHPHIALAALELWMANQCIPECPSEWLKSPNGENYGTDETTSTSITWCEMADNANPMAQPLVPYAWPNTGKGLYPGLNLYNASATKAAPGLYITEVVGGVKLEDDSHDSSHDSHDSHDHSSDDSSGTIASLVATFAAVSGSIMALVL